RLVDGIGLPLGSRAHRTQMAWRDALSLQLSRGLYDLDRATGVSPAGVGDDEPGCRQLLDLDERCTGEGGDFSGADPRRGIWRHKLAVAGDDASARTLGDRAARVEVGELLADNSQRQVFVTLCRQGEAHSFDICVGVLPVTRGCPVGGN